VAEARVIDVENGDKEDLRDVVKEFSKDGNVYKIMDGFFIDGRHFFQFDKEATEKRKHEKGDGPRMVECPRPLLPIA
jgi:hypothetical protein